MLVQIQKIMLKIAVHFREIYMQHHRHNVGYFCKK